jgi:hypothetical protein
MLIWCHLIITAKNYANIWPCPGLGTEGPTQFWCGLGRVCETRVSANSSFFPIENYKFQAKLIVGGPPAATTARASATAIPSPTTAVSTSTPSPVKCPETNDKQAVVIGAGIGVPLTLLALGMGIWALLERKRRKRAMAGVAYDGVTDGPHGPLMGTATKRPAKVELVSA